MTVEGSTIDPGFSPGVLTIDGDFDASAGGNTFMFDVYYNANIGAGYSDRLDITGDAIIPVVGNNGANQTVVNADVYAGYLQPSDRFSYVATVITANSGAIDDVPVNYQASNIAVDADYNPSPGLPYYADGSMANLYGGASSFSGPGPIFNVEVFAGLDLVEPPAMDPPMDMPPMDLSLIHI